MSTAVIAGILFVCLVGVALLGRRVHRYLPEDHLSADSKDAVKLAMGLVATMTALLLGLLISSAKGTYDTVRSEVMQMSAKVAFLDRVLALYGPEAADARRECRDDVADAVRRMWPAERREVAQLAPNEQAARPLLVALVSWLVVIFFGFSLVAPPNATTTLALVASAFSVACAVFLILELDHPLGGLIRVPSEPMVNVLNHLGK